ncbi:glycoside hydrolase family 31 protein [Sabulilitoribacter arenilitoris]|uniref:Glycoside hydrolase family 31 protein n=1 Tax=Wocania arenilitoris TaxID=2044858 RepID=A0AAE3EMZ0_9FLAO|nr:TIM-barrel domain-containing protein [Wocania arenilitoris]MCF7567194.1 glycoside hydrolase family 31 protein [Wocania arenilitoris]
MNLKNVLIWHLKMLLIILLSGCSSSLIKSDSGIIYEIFDAETNSIKKIAVNVLTPTVIKIAVAENDSLLDIESLIAKKSLENVFDFSVEEEKEKIIIRTDSLSVYLDKFTGEFDFKNHKEVLLMSAKKSRIKPFLQNGNRSFHIQQDFSWPNEEVLYGLGQHEQEDLSIRGKKIEMTQQNTRVSIPVILSSKGYGIYWDNYSKTVFDDTSEHPFIASEIGDKIEYYFIQGQRFDNIIASFRELTGEAPMLPKWALGYIQSRNRYKNKEELMKVVEKHRSLNIPLDAIILDYLHWGDSGFGSMVFDPVDFPDAEDMITILHDDFNCKLVVSVWPSFKINIDNWNLMNKKGFLLDLDLGKFGQVYDAFNPQAGKLYYDLVKKNYLDKGVDAIWFDATEPENFDEFTKTSCFLGPTSKYLNLYSYFDMKNIYERQSINRDKRAFVLTRSAFAGQQKFASVVWSGDIGVDFKTLKEQIPTGLNFCMTGLPYWNTDIGGYAGGDPKDPAYQEVFVRWFQYGTFTPFFRAHGRRYPMETRSGHNELWSYGSDNQKILTNYVNLRYRLLPYLYTLSYKVYSEGYTIMRALPFDFLHDKNVLKINDQFMFGSNIMVCPVLEPNAKKREVYLPKGGDWFDFWTHEKYSGGQFIIADSPIEIIPLFVKSGSILPMGEILQHTSEKPMDKLEIRLYTGKDADFTLYEDEGDNYNYINEIGTTIPMKYSEKNKVFTMGPTKGGFKGMQKEKRINLKVISKKKGAIIKEINYTGDLLKINIE